MKNKRQTDEQDIFPLSDSRIVESKTVVACFADIRGFTSFVQQDILNEHKLIDKLLESSYSALNKALRDAEGNIQFDTTFGIALRHSTRPTLTKTLGDGVMMIWEYPNSHKDEVKIGFKLFVLDFIHHFQDNFYILKMSLENSHPEHLELLQTIEIGIGVASGEAWKFSGFGIKGADYASNVINMAARLQDQARPRGLVARVTFDFNLFLERCFTNKEGRLDVIKLKGINEPTVVWKVDERVIRRRRSRKVDNFLDAQKTIENNENSENFSKYSASPLTPDDTQNIFDIRTKFEVKFVSDLCGRKLTQDELNNIDPNNSAEKFHENIAFYSATDSIEGQQRFDFIAWAYQKTEIVRSHAGDDAEQVHEQHSRIFEAIKARNTQAASMLMKEHLIDNCNKGRNNLIKKLISDFNKKDKN